MNKTLTVLAAALALAFPAHADDAHHPEKQQDKPAAAAKAPSVKALQDNVKKMQRQLDRAARAKTADERQKAIAEHMQTMRENMMMGQQMAGGAMDCPMHEGGMGMMGKGGMMGGGDPARHEAMMDRMQQMEKRMDMMQMMMERTMKPGGGEAMPGMGRP
jgi:hypothetical protein